MDTIRADSARPNNGGSLIVQGLCQADCYGSNAQAQTSSEGTCGGIEMSDSAVDRSARHAGHALVCALALSIAGCSATDRQRPVGNSDPNDPIGTGGSGANTGGSGATAGVGGSAGGATPGSGGTGAGQALDAGDDVRFVWPEAPPPGTGPGCLPGVYQGTFECTYTDAQDAGVALPVSGPISLRLVQSQQGELLEVRDGTLDGLGNLLFVFRSDIAGELNCNTSQFTGTLVNGTYSGFIIVNGTFTGTMNAGYDTTNFQLIGGTWQLAVNGGNGNCAGTWSANYFGP
jgi:hypothetical protein